MSVLLLVCRICFSLKAGFGKILDEISCYYGILYVCMELFKLQTMWKFPKKKISLDDRGLVRKNDFRFWELFLFAIPNFPSHRAIKYEHLIIHSYISSVCSNKPFDVTVFLHFNIWKCDHNMVIFHRGILCFIKIKFQWIFF